MTWFIMTFWALVATALFLALSRKSAPTDRMTWTVMLCLLWPVLLLFFLMGTALWFASSVYQALKRRRWEV